jgi:hypothetical protein
MGNKIILLNAVVPKDGCLCIKYLDLESAINLIRNAEQVVSFIGHPNTAQLISKISGREIGVNRGEYIPSSGDQALVIRLKRRLQTPGEAQPSAEDLEFLLVEYR